MQTNIDFVSIDPVSRMARIDFKSHMGIETLMISEYTFTALFTKWDEKKFGPMTDQQRRFAAIASKALKDPIKWFKDSVNEFQRTRAAAATAQKAQG